MNRIPYLTWSINNARGVPITDTRPFHKDRQLKIRRLRHQSLPHSPALLSKCQLPCWADVAIFQCHGKLKRKNSRHFLNGRQIKKDQPARLLSVRSRERQAQLDWLRSGTRVP